MKRLSCFFVLLIALLADDCTSAQAPFWPGATWPGAAPAAVGLDAETLMEARDYALSAGGAGCIVRHGNVVMKWGDTRRLFDLKSTTKSFGATALGLALLDGKVRLDDPAQKYHPTFGVPPESNAQTGWLGKITLRMLANQTAGFEKPGGYQPLLFEPGTAWHYSDGGPNWLAECLTLVYARDIKEVLFERVFDPIGIARSDLRWRNNAYRPHEINGLPRREFGSGISANIEAMVRFGYLYLHKGNWDGREILSPEFVRLASHTGPELKGLPVRDSQHGNASAHYGLLWWNNNDGALAGVPRDAFWTWGLYDSFVFVAPSLDLVVARAGKSWKREPGADHYAVLEPFFGKICQAVLPPTAQGSEPGGQMSQANSLPPPSPVIQGIHWAPASSILRRAKGSDNWPVTWGDDDALYTAYGDGNGFRPFVKEKLSLGLARIEGGPENFQGTNLRAPSAEAVGDGKRARKASGILMVDGVLYLLVRNAGNAQLGWSDDHGRTWMWADWRFTQSFGCPTFLNYGRNDAGARDGFVYIYSQDADSAYERADRFVLARVPKNRLRDRDAYEFFVRLGSEGQPLWSRDIAQRGAVFAHKGSCYRSGVTYDAGLKRYLWCQSGPGEDTRFAGGLAIFDAPEPWGPWTTVFHTDAWDVGPGETSSFPTKWMSEDGKTLHLVFSGDDFFSVRRADLEVSHERDR